MIQIKEQIRRVFIEHVFSMYLDLQIKIHRLAVTQ